MTINGKITYGHMTSPPNTEEDNDTTYLLLSCITHIKVIHVIVKAKWITFFGLFRAESLTTIWRQFVMWRTKLVNRKKM